MAFEVGKRRVNTAVGITCLTRSPVSLFDTENLFGKCFLFCNPLCLPSFAEGVILWTSPPWKRGRDPKGEGVRSNEQLLKHPHYGLPNGL